VITKRGEPIALLVAPGSLTAAARRPRQILPEYAPPMRQGFGATAADDSDALRDEQ